MEFDSLPEAFDFFNLYSWEVGFGIKYGASRRNKQGSLTMQEILCGCAVCSVATRSMSINADKIARAQW
jgi:hypothetical protein